MPEAAETDGGASSCSSPWCELARIAMLTRLGG
jgi:hypothetical protein